MLQFRVNGQRIERIDDSEPVEKSLNYLYARFDFDGSWRSTGRTALFKTGDTTYKTVLNSFCDNKVGISACAECIVPHEVLNKGSFTVSVYGVRTEDGKGVLITTDSVKIHVRGSGYVPDGSEPTPAELELIQQLQAEIAHIQSAYIANELAQWRPAVTYDPQDIPNVVRDHTPLITTSPVIDIVPVPSEFEDLYNDDDAWRIRLANDITASDDNIVVCEYFATVTPSANGNLSFYYNLTAVDVEYVGGSSAVVAGKTYHVHLRDGICTVEEAETVGE